MPPDAKLARKSYAETRLSHLDNYLMDNKSENYIICRSKYIKYQDEVNIIKNLSKTKGYRISIKKRKIIKVLK